MAELITSPLQFFRQRDSQPTLPPEAFVKDSPSLPVVENMGMAPRKALLTRYMLTAPFLIDHPNLPTVTRKAQASVPGKIPVSS